MEKIQNMTGCFYVVGYYIDEKWDGKYHKIKVNVDRPSLEVHAQKGYFNPKPFGEFSKLEKMLHLVDLALNNRSVFQDPLRFSLVSLPLSIKGNSYISLFAKLPMHNIHEFAGKNVEIVSIVFDEENSIIKIGRNNRDFSNFPERNMYYAEVTSLLPGMYKCRVVIRNTKTGRGAVASSSVVVPKNPDHDIKLYPPLLLKPDKDAFYLEKPPAVYPFDPNLYFPVVEQLEQGTSSLWAAVRCSFSGIPPPEIQLSANLIHSSSGRGRAIPATITILERYHDADTEIFLLSIQTEELKPGEYFLYLFAADGLTQSRSGTNTTFEVR
jgi:hypothetical protein